ncbi:MAG: carboxypeptidase-like regulatory domain-containing protein [Flavobacteriales bacterium]
MKKAFYLSIILCFSSGFLCAQNIYKIKFKAQVIDSISGLPIANAEIKFTNSSDSVVATTDKKGNFSTIIMSDQCYNLTVTAAYYKNFEFEKFYCLERHYKEKRSAMNIRWKKYKIIRLSK